MMKPPAVYVLMVWFAFLGMHGYYFLLDYWSTPHPSYLPLFLFIGLQGIALLLTVLVGVWRLIRGPMRLQTAAWLTLGFLPVFLWYSMVSLAFQFHEDRRARSVELRWYSLTTQPIAAALFDGIGRWTLPYRLDGERVVMFYDASIPDPQSDLEKMDDFIKKEEDYLGMSMPAKIHWLRTPILGLPGLALMRVAVAEPGYPYRHEKCIGVTDYHEAAHNIIAEPSVNSVYAGRYPPCFVVEGWAMARSEDWETLVGWCWRLKQSRQALTLREAVSDVYYNQTDHRLYEQGGAFVKVLCDKFGPEKFLELYLHCTRKTFERDIQRIYGMTLEELDALYWREIEWYRTSKYQKATEQCSPEETALLDEFREACDRQRQDFYKWTANGTLEFVVRTSCHGQKRDSDGQEESLFQARDGQTARFYKKYEGTRTDISQENGAKTELQFERIDCHLLTPNESLGLFQYFSNEENSLQQDTWRNDVASQEGEYRWQQFTRHHLTAFQPFSLFSTWYGHEFTNPEDYLWAPPVGTVIQSVVVEGDTVVLTLKMNVPDKPEITRATLTLRMDRSRDWLLLEAVSTETSNEKTLESFDIREYDVPGDGVPLLKKRLVSRNVEDDHITEEMQLVRFCPTPVDETVFHEDNLPLKVPPAKPAVIRSTVEQRTRIHLTMAACWLIVPLVIIFLRRQSNLRTE